MSFRSKCAYSIFVTQSRYYTVERTIDNVCKSINCDRSPEMSIIDYLLWGLQRYIRFGEERFFLAMREKYNLIIDLYDTAHYSGTMTNYYNREKPFSLEKASKFNL